MQHLILHAITNSSILFQYNVSMIGRYVLVLPAIKLSHIVPFEVAKNIRNPLEKPPSSKWNALTSALDDDSDSDDDLRDLDPLIENQPLHFRPKSVRYKQTFGELPYKVIIFCL